MAALPSTNRRSGGRTSKSPGAFRTISEVADDLGVPQHVLRFWESKFNQIRPLKRGGGRRYYRPEDVELLRGIQRLLHSEGYTIKGVQKIFREQGVKTIAAIGDDLPLPIEERFDSDPPPDPDPEAESSSRLDADLRAELEALREELVAIRRLLKPDA